MAGRDPGTSDWDRGSYELTAKQLAPVAPLTLDAVEPVDGLKLLDLACGTGNLALEAARRGAAVTGLDSAPRLLEVAGERADSAGLSIDWISADIEELPFEEDSYDVVTSVFGLIFADDAGRVAAEIGRVLAPSGRLAFTTWLDEGALARIMTHFWTRVSQARGESGDGEENGGEAAGPDQETDPLKWGDTDQIRELFAEHGISIRCERDALMSTADSPGAQVDEWFDHHPMWLAARDTLDTSSYEALRAECLEELRSANEDPSGFRIAQPYLRAFGSPV